jgi:CHAT domain-containing protein/Tfp pilus assembly protein PilF
MNDQVLALLGGETPPLPSGELTLTKQQLEGLAYSDLHRFSEAEKTIGEAEKSCAPPIYSICSDVALARGELDMERGRFEQAQLDFSQALARARGHSTPYVEAIALLNLSWAALRQEHFEAALDWASAAYSASVAIDALSVAQVALGNEGWAYYRLGDNDKALPLFIEARERARQLGTISHEVKWLTTAGYVYLDAHQYDRAEQSYQQALDLARQINSKEDILNALMSLALVAERTGKLEQARDYADQTIAMAPAEGNRLDVLYPMLVKGHVAARMHDAALAEKAFREIEQDPKSHVFLKWESEHSLAQLYEDEKQPDAAGREYRAALSTFETARSSLQHEESELPFPANAAGIYDDYIHFLVEQGKTVEALQVAEYSRGRTLSEGLGLLKKGTTFTLDPLNAQQIARRAGGTILFYRLGERESSLWAITPQKVSLVRLPPATEIDAEVQRYRKALIGSSQDVLETANPAGIALYQMLVAPAMQSSASEIAGADLTRAPKVFIIPDGSLNSLNFETLLAPDPKLHYWIEDVTIAEASSLHLLAASHSAGGKNASSLLLFGDAMVASGDYPPLPQAGVEMDSIAKHFPPDREAIFRREQASPTAYLENKPEQFSFIHFVAHGTASRLSPLDSAIVLSKASADTDSFKLYARDIMRHRLQAELVTVSTCYGAGSRAYSGEGLVGLSWAFLHAGAHNVIGALWEVSDASTPKLMDDLYTGLAKGQSPEAALRGAKLAMVHSGNAFRKPFYWAPFQLYTGS